MKKVLFISYLFPPTGGPGVQRSLKFVKYLPQFNWQPVVLTRKSTIRYARNDATMLTEVPEECTVLQLANCEKHPGNPFVRETDLKHAWYESGVKEGLEIIRKHDIRVIYTTSGPYVSHLIGLDLKRLTGKPWIADFRDEWTTNPFLLSGYWKADLQLNRNLEEAVLRNADAVISVTDRITEKLFELSGSSSREKFYTIPNGFDSEDLVEISNVPNNKKNKKFTICYMGSLYGPNKVLAKRYFQVFNLALKKRVIQPRDIEIRMIGRHDDSIAAASEVSRITIKAGYQPHRTALSNAATADLLLLFIHSCAPQVATGKIFELMRLGKPILAVVPSDGVAAEMIRATRTGIVVDPTDLKACVPHIQDFIKGWKIGITQFDPCDEEIQKYDRKTLTGQLAKIFECREELW